MLQVLRGAGALGAFLTISIIAAPAFANDANFQYSGASQKALSVAGVADGNDATSIAHNPAGLAHVEDEASFSASLLHPLRGFEGTDTGPFPGFTPMGVRESDSEYFGIPNLAISRRVSGFGLFDVVAFSIYGNGGLNTNYQAEPGSFACGFLPAPNPGTGPYCFGKTGVDLQQSFASIAFAKTIAPGFSVGVAPIVSRQQIKLRGFQAFGGVSSDPANLTNNGKDVAWGAGVRGGLELAIAPNVRFGAAASSRIYSDTFEEYRGAFAERGDLDIPATVQAGVAVDVTPRLTRPLVDRSRRRLRAARYADRLRNGARKSDASSRAYAWSSMKQR